MRRHVADGLERLAFWLCFFSPALGIPAQNADDGTTHVFHLKHVSNGYSLSCGRVDDQPSTKALTKQPDFAGRKVKRGVLQVGVEPDDFIDLIWDKSAGRLYLNLNRNGDLTDDPAFENKGEKAVAAFEQEFGNIAVGEEPSSKLDKARQLGIKTLNEKELLKLLESGE